MSTIFISHSSRDSQYAKAIEAWLVQQNHHSVFLDLDPEKGIVAGQSWERTLYRKLRACRAVIALCTDHYLRSNWCFAEVALARMEGKHIFALQVDPLSIDTPIPSILTERQLIDLRNNEEEGYRRLWLGLQEVDLLGMLGEWDPKRPPYLGLDAYQEEHAPIFFGREDEAQSALELIERGAPGLIMTLGASGSGKSSLVRAGMLPRLRREPERWLLVDPFRPGRDPFGELADALLLAYRRYAPDHAARLGRVEDLRDRLEVGAAELVRLHTRPNTRCEDNSRTTPSIDDERLQQLMTQLEELRRQPPAQASRPLLDFLNWSIDDLRQLCTRTLTPGNTPGARMGATPLVALADQLRRLSKQREARVLLVIDQFEEVFGFDEHDDRFHRFLTLLRVSVEIENSPLKILGTMRSDFLGVFQRHAALRGLDFESFSLGPIKTDSMRRVIEEPAKLGMIELETGLADRLLEDTETSDALPLLSFTLWVLWRNYHDDGRLEVSEYEDLGGLQGAVSTEADALLDSAEREGKTEELQRAFVKMARVTESGGYTRQPVSWDAPEMRPVHAILERFVDRRLLVSRDESGTRMVEVAHEALFRSWEPLKTWLDNHRSILLLRQQLQRDAETWEERQRATDNLWRGARLQQALELLRQDTAQLTKTNVSSIEAFVQAGVRRRNRQRLTIAVVAFCVFSVLTGFYFNSQHQRQVAKDETARVKNALLDMMDIAAEQVAREVDSQLHHLQMSLRAIRDAVDDMGISFEDVSGLGEDQTTGMQDIDDMTSIMEFGLTLNPAIKGFLLIPSPGMEIVPDQDFYDHISETDLNIDRLIKKLTENHYWLDLDGDITIGEPMFIPELEAWLTTMILRLPNEIDDRDSRLIVLISLNQLYQYIHEHQHNKGGKSLWIVDIKGDPLLSQAPGRDGDAQVIKDALKYMNDTMLPDSLPYDLPGGTKRLRTFRMMSYIRGLIILDRKFP